MTLGRGHVAIVKQLGLRRLGFRVRVSVSSSQKVGVRLGLAPVARRRSTVTNRVTGRR